MKRQDPPRAGDTVRVTFDGIVSRVTATGRIQLDDGCLSSRPIPPDAVVEVLTREPAYEAGLYEDAAGFIWRASTSADGEPEWEYPGDPGNAAPFTRPKRPLHRLVRQSDTTGGTDGE